MNVDDQQENQSDSNTFPPMGGHLTTAHPSALQ